MTDIGEKTSELVSRKIDAVKDLLTKWTDPKPEFSGMMANDMALRICAEIAKIESEIYL